MIRKKRCFVNGRFQLKQTAASGVHSSIRDEERDCGLKCENKWFFSRKSKKFYEQMLKTYILAVFFEPL